MARQQSQRTKVANDMTDPLMLSKDAISVIMNDPDMVLAMKSPKVGTDILIYGTHGCMPACLPCFLILYLALSKQWLPQSPPVQVVAAMTSLMADPSAVGKFFNDQEVSKGIMKLMQVVNGLQQKQQLGVGRLPRVYEDASPSMSNMSDDTWMDNN
jgi:hypothetical protein